MLTREPCELLTPSLATQYAGADAARKDTFGDSPVNHFHVFVPENEVQGLPFTAYRFGAGQSLVVVKDGLLDFKVSNDQGVEANWADAVKLAQVIVPRVG